MLFNKAQKVLFAAFAAWASGEKAKMQEGSDWKELTPDTLKIKSLDGEWVSVRDAIAAYDRSQGTDS